MSWPYVRLTMAMSDRCCPSSATFSTMPSRTSVPSISISWRMVRRAFPSHSTKLSSTGAKGLGTLPSYFASHGTTFESHASLHDACLELANAHILPATIVVRRMFYPRRYADQSSRPIFSNMVLANSSALHLILPIASASAFRNSTARRRLTGSYTARIRGFRQFPRSGAPRTASGVTIRSPRPALSTVSWLMKDRI
jgi:hypothetical protein